MKRDHKRPSGNQRDSRNQKRIKPKRKSRLMDVRHLGIRVLTPVECVYAFGQQVFEKKRGNPYIRTSSSRKKCIRIPFGAGINHVLHHNYNNLFFYSICCWNIWASRQLKIVRKKDIIVGKWAMLSVEKGELVTGMM